MISLIRMTLFSSFIHGYSSRFIFLVVVVLIATFSFIRIILEEIRRVLHGIPIIQTENMGG